MDDLIAQIKRFQSLGNITGRWQQSSYVVSIIFDPCTDDVTIELGGYDVGSWNRHTYINTTIANLVKDLTAKVDEAVDIVSNEDSDEADMGFG